MLKDDFLITSYNSYKMLIDNQCRIIREDPDGIRSVVGGGSGFVTGDELKKAVKEMQEYVDEQLTLKADKSDIPTVPTNVSEFSNDADYQTKQQVDLAIEQAIPEIPTVPSKVSQLDNDLDFQTKTQVDTLIAQAIPEIPVVPTKVSAFENDANYQTEQDVSSSISTATAPLATKKEMNDKLALKADKSEIGKIPTNVSDLNNDLDFQTSSEVTQTVSIAVLPLATKNELNLKADKSEIPVVPTKLSEFENDKDFQNKQQVDLAIEEAMKTVPEVPTKVSELENDSDFQTGIDVTNSISTATATLATKTELTEGLSLKADRTEIPVVPVNVSEFTNDANYQNKQQVDLAIEQAMPVVPDVPTKVSAFENDANYQTEQDVSSSISTATAPLATKAELNLKADRSDIPTVPTKLSEFENDKDFQTGIDVTNSISTATATLATKDELNLKADASFVNTNLELKQDKLSKTNKLPYIYIDNAPTKVSAFENDANYQTEQQVDGKTAGLASTDYVDNELALKADRSEIPTVPVNVSEFENDANYQDDKQVSTAISNATSTLASKAELNLKADRSEIPTVPTKLSEFENDLTNLSSVQIVDFNSSVDSLISGKLDKPETTGRTGDSLVLNNDNKLEYKSILEGMSAETLPINTRIVYKTTNNSFSLGSRRYEFIGTPEIYPVIIIEKDSSTGVTYYTPVGISLNEDIKIKEYDDGILSDKINITEPVVFFEKTYYVCLSHGMPVYDQNLMIPCINEIDGLKQRELAVVAMKSCAIWSRNSLCDGMGRNIETTYSTKNAYSLDYAKTQDIKTKLGLHSTSFNYVASQNGVLFFGLSCANWR